MEAPRHTTYGLFIILALIIILFCAAAVATLARAANDTDSPVWVIDTTGALTTGKYLVKTICWMDCGTDNDDFILHNAAGEIIWKDSEGEAGKPHIYYLDVVAEGLTLNTLDSGYLLIHARELNY